MIFKKEIFTVFKFFLPILSLIVLTSYTFHDMLKMIVWGQGFEVLTNGAQYAFYHNLPWSLVNFELSAVLLGTLGYKLFGLNFSLYYLTWVMITLAVSILLFHLTYVLTGRRLVAFSAALINTICYASQMGLIGWIDTSFIGRVPNLLLLIPSFTFLHLFLKQEKLKFYLISIILFFLGIGLGQFGLILGFSYILYPLFWHIFKCKQDGFYSSNLIKRVLVSASFAVISIFFLNIHSYGINPQGPDYSFTYFLLRPQTYRYLEQVPLQLSNWSNYLNLTRGIHINFNDYNGPFFEYKGAPRGYFADINASKAAVHGILAFYLLAILLIYFRLPEQRPLLLTIIFGTCIMLIENVYIDHYKPEIHGGASRYLLYPTIWLSVFWALFLWAGLWKGGNRLLVVLGIVILSGSYLVNTALIQDNLNEMLYAEYSTYRKATKLITYIKDTQFTIKSPTLVITPPDELDCQADIFLNEQLEKEEVFFWPLNANQTCLQPDGLEKIASSAAHVIRITYKKECDCVAEEKVK